MRPVIYQGVQYDADNLPKHVDASEVVPAEQWFQENRNAGPARREPIPDELPDPQAMPAPNDSETPKDTAGVPVEAPAKNGSLELWQEYARSKGATDADLEGKGRDELRDAYGA